MDIVKAIAAIVLRDMTHEARDRGSVAYRYGNRLFTIWKRDGSYSYFVEADKLTREQFLKQLGIETGNIIRR